MKVTITEARKHFYELVATAERGQTTLVTRYGKPIFMIGPIRPTPGAP